MTSARIIRTKGFGKSAKKKKKKTYGPLQSKQKNWGPLEGGTKKKKKKSGSKAPCWTQCRGGRKNNARYGRWARNKPGRAK